MVRQCVVVYQVRETVIGDVDAGAASRSAQSAEVRETVIGDVDAGAQLLMGTNRAVRETVIGDVDAGAAGTPSRAAAV